MSDFDDGELVGAMYAHDAEFRRVRGRIVENATEETAELVGDPQQNELRGLEGADPGEVVQSYFDDPGRGEILPEMMRELAETTDDPEGVMEPAREAARYEREGGR